MNYYQEDKTIFAQGIFHFGEDKVKVYSSFSYLSHSPEPIDVIFWSEENEVNRIFDSSLSYPGVAWFDGKSENGENIQILGVNVEELIDFHRIKGTGNFFTKGEINYIPKKTSVVPIYLNLSDCPIIIPERSYRTKYDGTISFNDDNKERHGIIWASEKGEATLIDYYSFINDVIWNFDLLVRLKKNTLILNFETQGDIDIKSILYQIPRFLFDDLNLISFLSRMRVVVEEASINYKEGEKYIDAFSRYKSWHGFRSLPTNQRFPYNIIDSKHLRDGLFNTLITNFKKSPYKEVIRKTIPFLLSSYEDGYIETILINAYAGLESMVDGISKIYKNEYLLNNNQFKRLTRKIKETIRQEISDDEIFEGVAKKLPELRRRAFLDRLIFLLRDQNVNSSLIWPPNTDEPKEFHNLLKRRNNLIHQGHLDYGIITSFDLSRIQKLLEIWILSLLECPEKFINKRNLYKYAPINKKI